MIYMYIYKRNESYNFQISRHGARSPTKPFPNDPYKDVWPQGYGQLTKVKQNLLLLLDFLDMISEITNKA